MDTDSLVLPSQTYEISMIDIIIVFVGASALLIEDWYFNIKVNSLKLQTLYNMSVVDKKHEFVVVIYYVREWLTEF